MRKIIIILVLVYLLIGCASHQKYGNIDWKGRVYYPLCERGKERIIDLQGISFELPELFKQVSCEDKSTYHLHKEDDLLNISLPSVMQNGEELGEYSMQFRTGIWYSHKHQQWNYRENTFSPEVFLEYKQDWHKLHGETPIESGWINIWPGGRCARLQFGKDNSSDYIQEVLYYCWAYSSGERRIVPFHISATQSIPKKTEDIPPKSAFTDLDNELIKPVMDSLEFYPLPDDALQFIADKFTRTCHLHHRFFDNKNQGNYVDFPDRRMIIRVLRDCGYDVQDPQITADSYDQIFEKEPDEKFTYLITDDQYPKDYQLIEVIYPYHKLSPEQFFQQENKEENQHPYVVKEIWYVYKIPHEKFARIKQKLLMLDVLKETDQVTRRMVDYRQNIRPRIDVPYEAWYHVPPRYLRRAYGTIGFGFRYDEALNARVIDINFDPETIPGYKFITLVEGD